MKKLTLIPIAIILLSGSANLNFAQAYSSSSEAERSSTATSQAASPNANGKANFSSSTSPSYTEIKKAIVANGDNFWREILENQINTFLSQNSTNLNILNLSYTGYSVQVNGILSKAFFSKSRELHNLNQLTLNYKEGDTKYNLNFNLFNSQWKDDINNLRNYSNGLGFSVGYSNKFYGDFSYLSSFSYNHFQGNFNRHYTTSKKSFDFKSKFGQEDLAFSSYLVYHFKKPSILAGKTDFEFQPFMGLGLVNSKNATFNDRSYTPYFDLHFPLSSGTTYQGKIGFTSQFSHVIIDNLFLRFDYMADFDFVRWAEITASLRSSENDKGEKIVFTSPLGRIFQEGRLMLDYQLSTINLGIYAELIKEKSIQTSIGIRAKIAF